MRRLIRADLHRILRKPVLYAIVLPLLVGIAVLWTGDTAEEQIHLQQTYLGMFALPLFCIPIYLCVYADEFKSGVLQGVIGRGMSRSKLITAKLLDCGLLLCVIFLLAVGIAVVKNTTVPELAITPRQNRLLLVYCAFCVLKGIGIFALASLVMFLSGSSAGGMMTLIIVSFLSKPFLKAIQEKLNIPFYDCSYEGLLEASFANVQAGRMGWQVIPAVAIYLLGVVLLNTIIFNRMELDL